MANLKNIKESKHFLTTCIILLVTAALVFAAACGDDDDDAADIDNAAGGKTYWTWTFNDGLDVTKKLCEKLFACQISPVDKTSVSQCDESSKIPPEAIGIVSKTWTEKLSQLESCDEVACCATPVAHCSAACLTILQCDTLQAAESGTRITTDPKYKSESDKHKSCVKACLGDHYCAGEPLDQLRNTDTTNIE